MSSAGPKGVFADVTRAKLEIKRAVELLAKQEREIKMLRAAVRFWDDMVGGTCLSQGDGPKDCISEKLRRHREKVQAELDKQKEPETLIGVSNEPLTTGEPGILSIQEPKP